MGLTKLLLGALVLLAAGGGSVAEPPVAKVKARLGEKTIALLDGATKVEAFRIDGKARAGDKAVAGFRITGTGKEQGKPFAGRLGSGLQQEKTLFGKQARCFIPGVAFRAHKGDESVVVLVCFVCKNLRLVAIDARGVEQPPISGAFGPRLGPLLALAKEAFPKDKEIQALAEKKSP
jgi:hypothetical protein